MWHIPLGIVHVGASQHPVVSMDYNLWVYQSNAQNTIHEGTSQWAEAKQQVIDGYKDYFMRNYVGNRAPVVIAGHFSQWNDGLYWEAMKDFASQVCGLPNVQCVTFGTLVQYLNATGTPPIVRD